MHASRTGVSRRAPVLVVVLAAAFAWAPAAVAQSDFPQRPVRLIAPFPPAGPTDVLARAIGTKLTEYWDQQVIVDNRPGAAGNIGTELAARAVPDGYTLLMGTIATHAINESLYTKLPFSPSKDFVPVALVAQTPSLVVVHPALAAKTFGEVVTLSKAKPYALNYAHAGVGTIGHLAMELLTMQTGMQVTHVPYKGTGPALTDTISGQTDFMITSALTAAPHVRNERLRALAITSAKRSAAWPNIPTIAESGYPDYVAVGWAGVFAPARIPPALSVRINADINRALASPDTRERLVAAGSEPASLSPAEFGVFVRAESEKWAKVVRKAGVRVD
jgi:tripartite-type tricarboxylate transporter receptor subunit TctC